MNSADKKYFLEEQIAEHHLEDDIWVTIFGRILDLSELVRTNKKFQELLRPILRRAGSDISHWFDPQTKNVIYSKNHKLKILLLALKKIEINFSVKSYVNFKILLNRYIFSKKNCFYAFKAQPQRLLTNG